MSDIERLVQMLAKLPGLGPRSARRAALHLIKRRESLLDPLATALADAAASVRTCATCGNLDTTEAMHRGTPDRVKQDAKTIIDICRPDCGLILSSGCLLAGDTPPENMQALSDAAREFGQF